MDGTGSLFAPFLGALERGAQVVRYPTTAPLGYPELTDFVRTSLPRGEPYVLLGESFSGPVAISLAAEAPAQLAGVILCCTFAKNPRPSLRRLGSLIPYLPAHPPLRILEALLCGRFASAALRNALAAALAEVSPSVMRARLAAVVSVDVSSQLRAIQVPVLYLKALEDSVVPSSASELIARGLAHGRVVELVAPHFLLQTAPKEAAVEVAKFMEEVGSAL
ncbi:alpha/beta fold hydrolase [Caenimonas terrae]|uniref:Alpha/beta fold hydrolase n=1 Tax=Caenimonas terrae TaxID=696074 RepID=A0ABW0NIJ7_9BURK